MIMDYESLYVQISKLLGIKFGETTADGLFTLLPVSCLGDCDHAPVMMINNDTWNNVEPGKVEGILKKYR
jgi:NADH-quinone oxidoreductase subunit E